MQLGRGHVNLGQQCPLKAREWETKLDLFKNGGVEEEERLSLVGAIVRAYGFALCVGTNRDIRVALSPKYPSLAIRLIVPMLRHVHTGGKCRSLGEELGRGPRIQGLVVYVGRRVGSGLCSSHLEES